MRNASPLARVAALALLAVCLSAAARPPRPAMPADVTFPANAISPLDARVMTQPQPVPANGKRHLVYELRLANFERRAVTLQGLDVIAADKPQRVLAHLTAAELKGMTLRRGSKSADDVLDIPGGGTALVYLWLTLDRAAPVPAALAHRLTVQEQGEPRPEIFTAPGPVVDRRPPVVIDPPLRGGRWGAFNGPSNTSNHRRSFIMVDGRETIAQRFATDWGKIDSNGDMFHGDEHVNANYPGYGVPIYAVADGIVTTVRADLPENTPPDGPKSFKTANDFAGNMISERIGPKLFALYGHMQGASIHLKPGDKVRRGQVIGRLGNSGNSSGPHLHFHICDSNSALGCEGLPFVFRRYAVDGHAGDAGISIEPAVIHRIEIPLEGDVVRFEP
ncbi:M23 family metallopeptidase [Phenylobacterium sp.]|jgi:hypothetical protein|uniref:M23 family metallopeptidase n=1 Tax=Phenylobacterium sp. TaxID=1871053 RepID=UPI002F3E702C